MTNQQKCLLTVLGANLLLEASYDISLPSFLRPPNSSICMKNDDIRSCCGVVTRVWKDSKDDVLIFTGASVRRANKSGWTFTGSGPSHPSQ